MTTQKDSISGLQVEFTINDTVHTTSFNLLTLAVDMAVKRLADVRSILHMHH